ARGLVELLLRGEVARGPRIVDAQHAALVAGRTAPALAVADRVPEGSRRTRLALERRGAELAFHTRIGLAAGALGRDRRGRAADSRRALPAWPQADVEETAVGARAERLRLELGRLRAAPILRLAVHDGAAQRPGRRGRGRAAGLYLDRRRAGWD